MCRVLNTTAPTSFTTSDPGVAPACQTQNSAPWGSANTAMRPAGPMSNGAISTWPPASATAVAVASASWTLT